MEEEEEDEDQTIFHLTRPNLYSGGMSGVMTDSIFYQFEVYKTRKQAELHGIRLPKMRNIYQGFLPNFLNIIPGSAVYFFAFQAGKGFYSLAGTEIKEEYPDFDVVESSFGGALAEFCSSATRSPLELVKTRMQAGQDSKIVDSVKKIYKAKGVGGFYQGFLPLVARDIPYSVIQFIVYDIIRKTNSKLNDDNYHSAFFRGLICGMVAGALTNPLDVIKTLAMTKPSEEGYKSYDLAMHVWNRYGLKGFARGVHYRLLYMGPSTAVFFMTYDKFIDHFHGYYDDE